MEAILNAAGLGFIVALVIIAAVLIVKSDGKGRDKGGPGCSSCHFPCEYNRTGKK